MGNEDLDLVVIKLGSQETKLHLNFEQIRDGLHAVEEHQLEFEDSEDESDVAIAKGLDQTQVILRHIRMLFMNEYNVK